MSTRQAICPGLTIGARLLASLCLAILLTASPQYALAIEDGLRLKIAGARISAAVRVGDIDAGESNCSGMMITPYHVLTAAHCPARCGMSVLLGSREDSGVERAIIEGSVRHPRYVSNTGDGTEFDAKVVRLFTPLYPRDARGRPLRNFRRDLIAHGPLTFEDHRAMVLGYGITSDADFDDNGRLSEEDFRDIGYLRIGQFKVKGLEGTNMKLERIDARLKHGDSGAAIVVPSHNETGLLDDYQIIGIVSTIRGGDVFGPPSASVKPWAEATVGGDHAPSLCPAAVNNAATVLW